MTKPCARPLARRLAAGSLIALAALATLAALDRGDAGYLPVEGARRMLANGGLPPAPATRFGFVALPLAQTALDEYVARRRLAALEADIIAVGVIARALEQQQAEEKAAYEAAALAELARTSPSLAFPAAAPDIPVAPSATATATASSEVTGSIASASQVPAPVPGQVPAVAAARITATDAATLAPIPHVASGEAKPAKRARGEADDDTPPRPAPARKPPAKAAAAGDSGWTRSIHDQSNN